MTDRLRRSVRTLIQGLPPAVLLQVAVAFGLPLNSDQAALAMVVLTAVSCFLINLFEDTTGVAVVPK